MADNLDQHAELMQQIVSHPEFTGLLQTIATNQFMQAQRQSSAIPNPQGQPPAPAPAPKIQPTADPFSTRVPGKDQSRVTSAPYPGDRQAWGDDKWR